MKNFLDYLDEFEKNKNKSSVEPIVEKATNEQKQENKPEVLYLNVEISTVEEAQKVIDEIKEWMSKQEPITNKYFESKKDIEQVKKFKIPPKKVIKSPIKESIERATEILNGLPDKNIVNNKTTQSNNIDINTKETVAGHAAALL